MPNSNKEKLFEYLLTFEGVGGGITLLPSVGIVLDSFNKHYFQMMGLSLRMISGVPSIYQFCTLPRFQLF